MVNKARLVESMANLVKDKRIDGIHFIRDESGRDGMRIVVELKRDAAAQIVLNKLFHIPSFRIRSELLCSRWLTESRRF